MPRAGTPTVEAFLRDSDHPRIAEVRELRDAILGSRSDITERVKWNAPSFCIGNDDRVTFRLQPGDRIDLVFHRGARTRSDSETFEFPDPSGRIKWATPDRGVVSIRDAQELAADRAALVALISRWMDATVDE